MTFSINEGSLEKGEETLLQDDAAFDNSSPISTPSFTKHKHGPTLSQCGTFRLIFSYPHFDIFSFLEPIPLEKLEHKTTGNPDLEITQKGNISIDQTWERDGKFNNLFIAKFTLTNKSKQEVSLRAVTSKYLTQQNQWVEAKTKIEGYTSGTIKLKAEDSMELNVCSTIEIASPQYDRLRR